MLSLHHVSQRLNVPVDTLWKWVTEGKLEATIQPGSGFGMEYYIEPGEMDRARELRDTDQAVESKPDDAAVESAGQPAANAVQDEETAPFVGEAPEFGERPEEGGATNGPTMPEDAASAGPADEPDRDAVQDDVRTPVAEILPPHSDWMWEGDRGLRTHAMVAMEGLRQETLGAVKRQVEHETSMREMIGALETVLGTTLKALSRAQNISQARMVSALEGLRTQLADHVTAREVEEESLTKEFYRIHAELGSMLKAMNPSAELPPLERVVRSESETAQVDDQDAEGQAETEGES